MKICQNHLFLCVIMSMRVLEREGERERERKGRSGLGEPKATPDTFLGSLLELSWGPWESVLGPLGAVLGPLGAVWALLATSEIALEGLLGSPERLLESKATPKWQGSVF